MNDTPESHRNRGREVIEIFDRQFAQLHLRSCSLLKEVPPESLYRNARTCASLPAYSMGENVLRSAAVVEQTFGGITANLWDDPFEWTLPEQLSTAQLVIEYLEEVEATRRFAFASFVHDADLSKEILVPAGNTRPLLQLLAETMVKAADYQGRAIAVLAVLGEVRSPDLRL
jgi:hypothetical protein